jgi:putative membrane protein
MISWWCAATDVAWSWTWRPYPGVWLFVAALVAGYTVLLARARPRHGDPVATRWQQTSYGAGVVLLWIASDWPIGTLGSGYLLGVHTLQYVLYSLVAPPLLLLGVPRSLVVGLASDHPRAWRLLRALAHPLVALLVFNLVLFLSHTPAVIDGVRPTQLGSFVVDMAWLAGGLVLWWPVVAPVPEVSRLTYPWKLGYLFLSTIPPTVPSAFLIFSDFPLYALYELAPRVNGIPATQDQLVAGIAMKILGDVVAWTAILIVAIRWTRAEAEFQRNEEGASPAPAG